MSHTHAVEYNADGSKVYHHGHHWANAHEEFEAAKQGMWVFMVTEVLMFGGLFLAYGIFRGLYPQMFHAASHHLNIPLGALNTVVLISSSLTMALGVAAIQRNNRARAGKMLLATIALAGCFLVVKYFEYAHKFHDGLLPGGMFTNKELLEAQPKSPLFFSIYFAMTGLHGVHVILGMGLIFWIWLRNRRGDFNDRHYTAIELVGFYWHFVDLVWIYVFPLLYLVG